MLFLKVYFFIFMKASPLKRQIIPSGFGRDQNTANGNGIFGPTFGRWPEQMTNNVPGCVSKKLFLGECCSAVLMCVSICCFNPFCLFMTPIMFS